MPQIRSQCKKVPKNPEASKKSNVHIKRAKTRKRENAETATDKRKKD
jgi:hypothetical protein